jgi:D-glycero-alpha-D-manno-heptose 1-phosphate guanylyltransferase
MKFLANEMEAIILSGGLGTRLRGTIENLPKSMAPIRGVPFLSLLLNQLSSKGFTKVILAVGYLGEKIEVYYGTKFGNLDLVYSHEEKPIGTGGAIIRALAYTKSNYVYVLNGDTFFDVEFSRSDRTKSVKIYCKHMQDVSRYGSLNIRNNRVVEFKEKGPIDSGYINGGVYLINRFLFSDYKLPNKFSFEKDFLEKYTQRISIETEISDGYFIDIGIPSDYEKAQYELLE